MEGGNLALSWVGNFFGTYSNMVGKSPEFIIHGRTSDGTEFLRSYTFHFINAGINRFDSDLDYCVVDGQLHPCNCNDNEIGSK